MGKAAINNFFDLDAWRKAHVFLLSIYKITKKFPVEELYGLTSQLRRAAVSITCNIAEGFSRYHFKEKVNFYYNARGSISEVQSLLLVARDVDYIKDEDWRQLASQGEEVKKLINGLVRALDKQLGLA